MRLVFMGTAAFAVPSLEALAGGPHEVTGTVTQPDRPRGRGQRVQPSPVGEACSALGLERLQPNRLDDGDFRKWIRARSPEVVVVVAYGKLIPPWLLTLPAHGVVNLHPSLLPRYRGAAPVNWAIARGESRTGVCTMQLDEGLDTGPVFACREETIRSEDTAPELSGRLARIGADLLLETLRAISTGRARPRPQSRSEATFAPRLRREDGYVRWEWAAMDIHNRIRGFLPWPGVVAGFRGQRCRLLSSRPGEAVTGEGPLGELRWEAGRLEVRCGDRRWLQIIELQLDSRKATDARDFANGFRLGRGERLTSLAATLEAGES